MPSCRLPYSSKIPYLTEKPCDSGLGTAPALVLAVKAIFQKGTDVAIDTILGVHGAAMLARGRRAEILASNLANADTPNYKARDIDFAELMRANLGMSDARLIKTDARHMDAGSDRYFGAEVMYRQPSQPSLDGNTVDTQIEQAEFMKNALQYQTSLELLNRRIAGLRAAIRGD